MSRSVTFNSRPEYRVSSCVQLNIRTKTNIQICCLSVTFNSRPEYSLTNVLLRFTNQIKSVSLNHAKCWPDYRRDKTETNMACFRRKAIQIWGPALSRSLQRRKNHFMARIRSDSRYVRYHFLYGALCSIEHAPTLNNIDE